MKNPEQMPPESEEFGQEKEPIVDAGTIEQIRERLIEDFENAAKNFPPKKG